MMIEILTKSENKDKINDLVKITALLIHAAKIDEHYSDKEKLIISDFLKTIQSKVNVNEIIEKAEVEEKNSNHILEYTREIKKNTLDFKKEIIRILWKIILSDNNADMYEGTLMRRIAGLLYVPDKLLGEIKLEILNKK